MRRAARWFGGTVGLWGAMLLYASGAHGAACGDANRTGTVTVTDGVLVLRAAAQLPAICPQERCDMNLDDRVTVTDGVLALRVAAGITTQVACSATQADSIFGQILKGSAAGRTASPAGRVRAANTTVECSGGGFTEDDGVTLTFHECAEGDYVTDGTLAFAGDGAGTATVTFDTTDFVVSTGEVFDTFGELTYDFTGDDIRVNGVLDYFSDVVGAYTTEFDDIALDQAFALLSGTVFTTVTDGTGLFANVGEIEIIIYSPTLARIFVDYTSGDSDGFTLAEGLCAPCSSGCSNASLACVSCVDQCGGGGDRCGVDFDVTACDDGVYGPSGLCEPCNSNSECNASDGLSCFECARDCTGSTPRCGSSIAFVECRDGFF